MSIPSSAPAAATLSGPPPASFASLACVPPGALSSSYVDLCKGAWPGLQQLPVVYHPRYNISFFGIEKLHPFDACKFKKVVASLKQRGVLREGQTVLPAEASLEVLADVHTADYLYKIHNHNFTVVQVTELAPLAMLPNKLLQWRIIGPMRLHVGGTMLAAGLALERGWAINLGGGMHHASSEGGMGWCPFDDMVLAIRRVRRAMAARAQHAQQAPQAQADTPPPAAAAEATGGSGSSGGSGSGAGSGSEGGEDSPVAAAGDVGPSGSDGGGVSGVSSDGAAGAAAAAAGTDGWRGVVLVIDLDAHQGNGVERDKLSLPVPDLYILDAYNALIFPRDDPAKAAIDIAIELRPHTGDDVYLRRLSQALTRAAATLPRPDLVLYNAGTDVLAGDSLGRLGLTAECVIERDEMVWRWCRDVVRAPVAMMLSGGYTRESAGVIADSIANLFDKFGLGEVPGMELAAAGAEAEA